MDTNNKIMGVGVITFIAGLTVGLTMREPSSPSTDLPPEQYLEAAKVEAVSDLMAMQQWTEASQRMLKYFPREKGMALQRRAAKRAMEKNIQELNCRWALEVALHYGIVRDPGEFVCATPPVKKEPFSCKQEKVSDTSTATAAEKAPTVEDVTQELRKLFGPSDELERFVKTVTIPSAPAGLPRVKGYEWPKLLRMALYSFGFYAPAYRINWSDNQELMWDALARYGLVQAENAAIAELKKSVEFRTKVLPAIYRSPPLRQAVYEWAMPVARKVFKLLHPQVQSDYLDILRAGRDYLTRENLEKELAYYKKLRSEKCKPDEDCLRQPGHTFHFAFPESNGHDATRSLKAFLFRRWHFDHVAADVLLEYVGKTITAFETAAAEARQPTGPTVTIKQNLPTEEEED